MSLPEEEARAIAHTRSFLFYLLDPRMTPRVPLAVRKQASRLLKHYPILPPDWAYKPLHERVIRKSRIGRKA
jgi:hypothetical protein